MSHAAPPGGGDPCEPLEGLRRTVESTRPPVFVFSLLELSVCMLNRSAAALLGSRGDDEPLGYPINDILAGRDRAEVERVASALAAGTMECNQAHRRLHTSTGVHTVLFWVHAVSGPDLSLAVATIIPPQAWTAEDDATTDSGNLREKPGTGLDLAGLVHPQDVNRLGDSLREAIRETDDRIVRFRLGRDGDGWREVSCLISARSTADGAHLGLAQHPGEINATQVPLEIANPRLALQLETLPERQQKVVHMLLRGDRVSMIAKSLHVSESTVRSHLSKIFTRFGVRSQTELLERLRQP